MIVGGLTAFVAVPLVIGLGVLHEPRWLSLTDVAQMEMRVRDVGSSHPPLVGLSSRLRGYGEFGSHPGPLGFYALAPVYNLFGADGWSLLVAAAALTLTATALSIWVGYRRGGWRLALAVTVVLTLLFRAYGIEKVVDAWNPHLPLAWWILFLLAVWSVLDDDLAMLPVAVVAGSYCVQTHIPYVGPVVVLGLVTVAWLIWRLVAARDDPDRRRRLLRWSAGTIGLLGLLWLPPLVDQLTNDPGNLALILDNFRNPYDVRPPFGDAWNAWLGRLDLADLLRRDLPVAELRSSGLSWAGALVLAAWVGSAVVAGRRRDASLIRLHVVTGSAFVAGLVAMSRIFGPLFPYLMLWAWGTTALMLLATLWTLLSAPATAPATAPGRPQPEWRWPAPASAALGGAAVVLGTLFAYEAAHAEMDTAPVSEALGRMSRATVGRLADDPVGCGEDCRYLVTWNDPIYLGSQGFGLMVELERQGYEVGAGPSQELAVRDHRVLDPTQADATIHVAVTESAIEEARERPGSVELEYVDPYTPAERADQEPFLRDLAQTLDAEGFGDLAGEVREAGTTEGPLPVEQGMSYDLYLMIQRFNWLTRPSAVFFLPSG